MTTTELKDKIKASYTNATVPFKPEDVRFPKNKAIEYSNMCSVYYSGYKDAVDNVSQLIEQFERYNATATDERKARNELMRASAQAFEAISHAIIGE